MTDEPRVRVDDDGYRPPRGYSWQPFQPGNEVRKVHGAYSPVRKLAEDEDVKAAADALLELAPVTTEADGPMAVLCAIALERVARARAGVRDLEERGEPVPPALASDFRGWLRDAARLLDSLAMSPVSRARLGLDVARTGQAVTLLDLVAQQEERRRLEAAGEVVAGDGEVVADVPKGQPDGEAVSDGDG
jgi:hypothetical protein